VDKTIATFLHWRKNITAYFEAQGAISKEF
jgi:hypothetical protein